MHDRPPDLSSLAALTADSATRDDYEAARLAWLERAVGFDVLYCGAAGPAAPVAPTVTGVSTAYVDRCERQAERYWQDRMRLNRAAARHGGAVSDHDALPRSARDRMPFYREILAGLGVSAMATVLLRARGATVGCLYLGRVGRGARFGRRDVEMLRAAGPLLGLGVALHPHDPPAAPARAALTPREREVAALACKGMTNHEIGALLGTSPRTVKNQLASVFRKENVSNRTELAALMLR